MQPQSKRKQEPDKCHCAQSIWFWIFFYLRGLTLWVWQTTNRSIGVSNLTNINFANIGEQVKLIDTLKYYQQSLSNLADTMAEIEKQNIKFQCKKFI